MIKRLKVGESKGRNTTLCLRVGRKLRALWVARIVGASDGQYKLEREFIIGRDTPVTWDKGAEGKKTGFGYKTATVDTRDLFQIGYKDKQTGERESHFFEISAHGPVVEVSPEDAYARFGVDYEPAY